MSKRDNRIETTMPFIIVGAAFTKKRFPKKLALERLFQGTWNGLPLSNHSVLLVLVVFREEDSSFARFSKRILFFFSVPLDWMEATNAFFVGFPLPTIIVAATAAAAADTAFDLHSTGTVASPPV